ncbi:hypothetical protein NL676_018310 [Syzygium grande]|nr:hypothetical protein NL676_018310 [Syzygium grande]
MHFLAFHQSMDLAARFEHNRESEAIGHHAHAPHSTEQKNDLPIQFILRTPPEHDVPMRYIRVENSVEHLMGIRHFLELSTSRDDFWGNIVVLLEAITDHLGVNLMKSLLGPT